MCALVVRILHIRAKGFYYDWFEPFALALVKMFHDLSAHSGIPELADVIRDTCRSAGAIFIDLEEGTDVIGHLDEAGDVHEGTGS